MPDYDTIAQAREQKPYFWNYDKPQVSCLNGVDKTRKQIKTLAIVIFPSPLFYFAYHNF